MPSLPGPRAAALFAVLISVAILISGSGVPSVHGSGGGIVLTACQKLTNSLSWVQGNFSVLGNQYLYEDHVGYVKIFQSGSYLEERATDINGHSVYDHFIFFSYSGQTVGEDLSIAGPYTVVNNVWDQYNGGSNQVYLRGNAAYPICSGPYQPTP